MPRHLDPGRAPGLPLRWWTRGSHRVSAHPTPADETLEVALPWIIGRSRQAGFGEDIESYLTVEATRRGRIRRLLPRRRPR